MKKEVEEEEKIVGDLNWDGLHRPRIYYAMATTFCGLFLSVLDGTICNVALPSIAQQLHVSSSDSIWIVNSFQLVIMMTLLPFSSMGERWGYKQVYLRGVVVFTIGSLLCSLSPNLPLLVLSRVFQGFGAAMIMSVNTSLIKLIYPKRRLGEGVGLNATVVALASVTGPTLAAAILSFASWPWLFAINIPVGIATFILGRKFLPDNAVKVLGRRFNWKEALLNAAHLRALYRLCRGLLARCAGALGVVRSRFAGCCGYCVCAHAAARALHALSQSRFPSSRCRLQPAYLLYGSDDLYDSHALPAGQHLSLRCRGHRTAHDLVARW